MKKIFVLFLLSILVLSCAKKENNNKVLIVGTCPIFPPFTYIDENSDQIVVGFEVELAKEIAQDLGLILKIEKMDFQNLIPALQNGDIDVIISSMTITNPRKEILDFSISYYETPQKILIRKDNTKIANINKKEDLDRNIKIASLTGTTGILLAKKITDENNIIEASSWDDMIKYVLDKEVDAVIIDIGSVSKFVSMHNELTLLPITLETEHYGMAVAKQNTALLDSINLTISRLVNSGHYGRLVEEYVNGYYQKTNI